MVEKFVKVLSNQTTYISNECWYFINKLGNELKHVPSDQTGRLGRKTIRGDLKLFKPNKCVILRNK